MSQGIMGTHPLSLDAINAALALGDPVILPKGTVAVVRSPGAPGGVEQVVLGDCTDCRAAHLRYYCHNTLAPWGAAGGWSVLSRQIVEVLWIPEGAPPFEQWPRGD